MRTMMTMTEKSRIPGFEKVKIPERVYFRIGDVSSLIGVKPYVLRYWETEFPIISPQKSNTGQRVYRRTDVQTLFMIKHLLYEERYSIEGARKRINDLRKEGELKGFKQEKVAAQTRVHEPASEVLEVAAVLTESEERKKAREACLKEIRGLGLELQALAAAPIAEIFSV